MVKKFTLSANGCEIIADHMEAAGGPAAPLMRDIATEKRATARTNAERRKAYRARQAAHGRVQINVWLTESACAALGVLGGSTTDAVNAALIECAHQRLSERDAADKR